ncbi:MAG TPA: sigma-70 family RNA polymerase sigma factor [Thermoanaerobaculia bacterium]|nr:sigma-70 family RNA polymerase sigma factor [Thermoanaerobaculia bacterium]
MDETGYETGAAGRRVEGAGPSDAELALAARGGADDAFRLLVERFERPVFSLVVRMVRDRGAAEDLTQETFVKAYRKLRTYDPERKFSSWLFKIAHNATIDHLRRRELETVPLDSGGGDDEAPSLARVLADAGRGPAVDAGRGQLAGALEAAVGRLRPEYREVVLLRFAEGLGYEEIAEAAELPLGTVKTYIHRARKELMTSLVEAGWGPEGLA